MDEQGKCLREIEARAGADRLFVGGAQAHPPQKPLNESGNTAVDGKYLHLEMRPDHQSGFGNRGIDPGDVPRALVRRPERYDRIAGRQDPEGWMEVQPQVGQPAGVLEGLGEGGGGDGDGVRRMHGLKARHLEPGDVGQIGHCRRRGEVLDERGKVLAIACENGRAGWGGAHEQSRHRAKKRLTDELQAHREAVGERIDEGNDDIVAVHSETQAWVRAVPGRQTCRERLISSKQGPREQLLRAHCRRSPGIGAAVPSRRSACRLSVHNTSKAGSSLSRSSSVGSGPVSESA